LELLSLKKRRNFRNASQTQKSSLSIDLLADRS
jgi:hypothetical protein